MAHQGPACTQPRPNIRLAASATIGVCRVEEVDAHFIGCIHDGVSLALTFALTEQGGQAADAAKIAAAEPYGRDLQPRATEWFVFHACIKLIDYSASRD